MKPGHINRKNELYEKSNLQTLPIIHDRRSRDLKTRTFVFISLFKNKLNTRIKKILFLSGLFIVSINLVSGQNYDFRKTTWGMSYEQVKNSELPKIGMVSEKRLIYTDTIAESPCILIYTFNEKQELISARYILDKNYVDHNFYFNEYNKFKELLTKKYGVPKKNEKNWIVNVEDKDSTNWANSLESGHLSLYSLWKTPKTVITLIVSKYDIVHLIIYYKAANFKDYDISDYSTDEI
jgi:hypothetical protein